jgi:mannitol-1-phosphate 5-dehydrogenase
MSKRAIHFGAGNIGRGFLGQLYFESGYATTFVDVADAVVNGLNERGGYPLRIVDEEPRTIDIEDVSAVHGSDLDAVANAVAEADIASTAVGVNVLPHVAPGIAAGIAKRFASPDAAPLNIIVCENKIEAGPYLREEVRKHLDSAHHAALDEQVGFVEASIGRMVPVMTDAQRAEDPLLVCVEAYSDLPVDRAAFKGPIPQIKNLQPRDNFGAYVERKLFVHNASHAVTAYLGHLRGHTYIWQAIADEVVRADVQEALSESCRALAIKHRLDIAPLGDHAEDLMRRYRNRALGDQIARVAADPVRKLGPNDRLVGAARMCMEFDVDPDHLARSIAAAIRYDHPDDPSAGKVQALLAKSGPDAVLRDICDINPEEPLAELIRQGLAATEKSPWA